MKNDGPFKLGALCIVIGFELARRTFNSFKRSRAIQNLPTAKIASAPSGECEFQGVAWPTADGLCRTPMGTASVYFEFQVEELVQKGRNRSWDVVHESKTLSPFILADESGFVLVHPRGGEVQAPSETTKWTDLAPQQQEQLVRGLKDKVRGFPPERYFFGLMTTTQFRIVEKIIRPGSPVLLHGTFHPQAEEVWLTPYAGFQEFHRESAALLSGPQAVLLARFDTNRDGAIDSEELRAGFGNIARAAVGRARQTASPAPPLPYAIPSSGDVKKTSGQSFFLSDTHEQHLLKELGTYHWLKLAAAIGLIAFGAFMVATGFLQ